MNHSTIPSSPGFSLVGLSNMRSVPRRKTSYRRRMSQIFIWREPGRNGGFIGFNGDLMRFHGDLR